MSVMRCLWEVLRPTGVFVGFVGFVVGGGIGKEGGGKEGGGHVILGYCRLRYRSFLFLF